MQSDEFTMYLGARPAVQNPHAANGVCASNGRNVTGPGAHFDTGEEIKKEGKYERGGYTDSQAGCWALLCPAPGEAHLRVV